MKPSLSRGLSSALSLWVSLALTACVAAAPQPPASGAAGAAAGQVLTVEATPLNTTAELGAMALDSAQELAAYAAAAEARWSTPKAYALAQSPDAPLRHSDQRPKFRSVSPRLASTLAEDHAMRSQRDREQALADSRHIHHRVTEHHKLHPTPTSIDPSTLQPPPPHVKLPQGHLDGQERFHQSPRGQAAANAIQQAAASAPAQALPNGVNHNHVSIAHGLRWQRPIAPVSGRAVEAQAGLRLLQQDAPVPSRHLTISHASRALDGMPLATQVIVVQKDPDGSQFEAAHTTLTLPDGQQRVDYWHRAVAPSGARMTAFLSRIKGAARQEAWDGAIAVQHANGSILRAMNVAQGGSEDAPVWLVKDPLARIQCHVVALASGEMSARARVDGAGQEAATSGGPIAPSADEVASGATDPASPLVDLSHLAGGAWAPAGADLDAAAAVGAAMAQAYGS